MLHGFDDCSSVVLDQPYQSVVIGMHTYRANTDRFVIELNFIFNALRVYSWERKKHFFNFRFALDETAWVLSFSFLFYFIYLSLTTAAIMKIDVARQIVSPQNFSFITVFRITVQ